MPDMSDELTLVEARAKLNAAIDARDQRAMAKWARDYGPDALDIIEELKEKPRKRGIYA